MKVTVNGITLEFEPKTTIEAIMNKFGCSGICAKVNGRIKELSFELSYDSVIEFLDLSDESALSIYQASLRYIIAMAVHNLYGKNKNIRFSNSISMALFAKIEGMITDRFELQKLEKEVRRIISLDLKLVRKKYSIEEMKEYYSELGYFDKIETLKYRKESVNVYECEGYRNYMYSYMVPSTSYIKDFKFIVYLPGFMIQFPRSENDGNIPEFIDEPNFKKTLNKATKWSEISDSLNIYNINSKLDDEEELLKYVNMCEHRHNQQLTELGDRIERNISDIRLISIAGPSSSGKTTFSKRLEIELLSRGIHPTRISLDNYYLHPSKCPIDKNGKPDFEHIDALNIELFNENMNDFLMGNEVRLPIFNFTTKETTFMEPMKLSRDGVIIIEGIHALNPKLTESISDENIFKIYIVPMAQRNIDNHNPISLTDLRLIRRIVRDKQFRSTDALKTLDSWKSVRDGERRWIYPFMETADYIFNSELGFEFLALKQQAMESLKTVPYEANEYVRANHLLKFLKIYRTMPHNLIQNNSLVREFIGGSVFKD